MNRIESIYVVLNRLRGLPMWSAGWAGPIAWFQFGGPVGRASRRGGQRSVGQYALHLSCPWRWCAPSGYVRADERSPPSSLQALGESAACLAGVEADFRGALILSFDSGDTLGIDDVTEGGEMNDARHSVGCAL